MYEWLGTIVISIAVKSLKDIYSDPTVYVATPLSEDSTIKVHREAFNDVDTPYYRHNGRTIQVLIYGYSTSSKKYIDSFIIFSCLDFQYTKAIIEQILEQTQ